MKTPKYIIILFLVVFILAIGISTPNFEFEVGDRTVSVRGLEPGDLRLESIFSKFAFNPSLDFEGGIVTVLEVELLATDEEEKIREFEETKDIVAQRLSALRLGDFRLTSYYNTQNDVFELHLLTPEQVDPNILGLLLSNGRLGFWIQDEDAEPTEEEQQLNPFFAGRKELDLSNEDIEGVRIISDSRIYIQDPSQPFDNGLEVKFSDESKPELFEASSSRSPILVTVDNSPIAFQASGQIATQIDYGDTILLATLLPDIDVYNSLLSSIMRSTSIDGFVNITESYSSQPHIVGSSKIDITANLAIGFIMLCSAMGVFFGRRSVSSIVSISFYVAVAIATFQMLNSILSITMIVGFGVAFVYFVLFLIHINTRLENRSKQGLTDNEVQGVINTSRDQHQKVFILMIALGLILQFWGTVSFYHFGFGLGVGAVGGYITFLLAIPIIYPYVYLELMNDES